MSKFVKLLSTPGLDFAVTTKLGRGGEKKEREKSAFIDLFIKKKSLRSRKKHKWIQKASHSGRLPPSLSNPTVKDLSSHFHSRTPF